MNLSQIINWKILGGLLDGHFYFGGGALQYKVAYKHVGMTEAKTW